MHPPGPQSAIVDVFGASQLSAVLSDDSASPQPELQVRDADPGNVRRTSDHPPDCVIIGERLSGTDHDCLSLVEESQDTYPEIPIIVLVEKNYEQRVAKALRMGASDCLPQSLVEKAPRRLRDRVCSTVRQARARTGYRAIYDNVAEPVTLHDPDSGTLVHANRAICDLLGYEREELHSMRVEEFTAGLPGYDQARAVETITAATEEGTFGPVEWPLETKDGERRWVESHLTPVRIGGRELILASSTDITDRKRREQEYERIFNEVDAAITVHDPADRSMVEVNETMAEWTGYDRSELLAGGVELFSATDQGFTPERAYEVIETVAESGRDQTVEWKIETAEGEHRWLEARATTASIGGEQRVLGISQDITERKRREREYEQIFNGVNDGITVFDPETGEIVDVNDTYYEMLGYEDFDRIRELGIEGLSVTEEGYTGERGKALIRQVADTGDPETVEWRGERKDGERIWIEATLAPVEIKGEERVVSMQRDVTERKRREREFEQIFNSVNDIINVYDPETKELIEVNETMSSLLGYEREEILSRDVEGVSATGLGYTRSRVESVIDRVDREDEPVEGLEWALRGASGEIIWVEVNATPAVINGERRILAIARDITGRKDREERVQVLNRVLRHNLRNDMDAVKGYAEMLADDPVKYREYADRIKQVAGDLVELGLKARDIEEILTRRDAGRIEPLQEVVRESVSNVRASASEATIKTNISDLDVRVNGSILQAVLRELLENAIEHNDTGTPRIEVRAAGQNPNEGPAEVRIADNGSGIPDQELTTLRKGEERDLQHGRGLGLWLIKWGMRRVNGRIEFSTDESHGTVATLYLHGMTDDPQGE